MRCCGLLALVDGVPVCLSCRRPWRGEALAKIRLEGGSPDDRVPRARIGA